MFGLDVLNYGKEQQYNILLFIIHNSCGRNTIRIGPINQEYNGWSFAHNLFWLQLVIQMISVYA